MGVLFLRMNMRCQFVFTAVLWLFCSVSSWAHSNEFLDSQKAPNGGQIRSAGAYHVELVMAKDIKAAKENPVHIYLTDHAGNKVSAAGVTANLTLLDGKTKTNQELKADSGNRLSGTAVYASNPSLKAVVSITVQNQQAQARYSPFAEPKKNHADHKH
jgi:hypothetical protein